MRKTQGWKSSKQSLILCDSHFIGPLGLPIPLLVLSKYSPVPSWCFSLYSRLGTESPHLRKLPLAFLPTCAALTLLHGETGEPVKGLLCKCVDLSLYPQHPCENAGSIDHGRPPEPDGRHHGEDHAHLSQNIELSSWNEAEGFGPAG